MSNRNEILGADRAVSPVIGSFLMVLVVVVAFGAFLSPMLLPSVQEAEPNANVEITFDGDETATVTYWNGETLQASQVTILVDGEQAASQFWGTVRPGDSVSIPVEPGDSVQVIWVSSEGTRSAVLGAAVVGLPTGSPTPTTTATPTETPTESVPFEELTAAVDVNENNDPRKLRHVDFEYTLDSSHEVSFEIVDTDSGEDIESDSETGESGTVGFTGVNEPLPVLLRGYVAGGECYEITVPDEGDLDGSTLDLRATGDPCDE